MKIINPATEEIITELTEDNSSSVQQKVSGLRQGQSVWQDTSVASRIETILRFGQLLTEKTEDLALLLTQETGKPLQQSRGEITGAHNRTQHIRDNAAQWLQTEEVVITGNTLEKIAYEPLGVIANISAWNFPYNVGFNVFLYALVAGNAVLYKPSEFATLTGLQFRDLLWQAGVPKDVFACVIGGANTGEAMLDAHLDGYYFTGSYKTGKHIAQRVASKLVPLQLELGGKDPLYVADDIKDVGIAAENAAEGAFYNNGQSCCAVERIYVHQAIYSDFVTAFVKAVQGYVVGDPQKETTFIGPLTRGPQIEVLTKQTEDAVNKGASLLAGGHALEQQGHYFAPTVLTNTNHNMLVMKEESFGPIIGIQSVAGDDEALSLMQDTDYGLTAAVFSSSQERAENILRRMNTGTVYWNCCDRVSPTLPWSGRKNSGLGSTLSHLGIRAFTQPKAYHLRKI